MNLIWNPSTGIDLGFFTIHYYSLMFVVAFSLGFYLMKKIFIRENIDEEKLDSIFMYAVIATLLGARLGHVFFYDWAYYKNNLLEILLPVRFSPSFEFTGFQGLASHGAAIAFVISMYLYSKNVIQKPVLWVLDRVTIPAAFGGIFVRIGNFFNSEIIGNITSGPMGVKFVQSEVSRNQAVNLTGIKNVKSAYQELVINPKFTSVLEVLPFRHPAQLYEAFGYVFVSFILYYLYWKTTKRTQLGFLFGSYMLLIFSVRFVVEFVKKSQGGFESILGMFSTGQWLSIPFIAVGIYFLVTSKSRSVN